MFRLERHDLSLQRVRVVKFEGRYRQLIARLQPHKISFDRRESSTLFHCGIHRGHYPFGFRAPPNEA